MFTTAANDALIQHAQLARSMPNRQRLEPHLSNAYNRFLKRYKTLFDVHALPMDASVCRQVLVDAVMTVFYLANYLVLLDRLLVLD
jgi:hypothetical protein